MLDRWHADEPTRVANHHVDRLRRDLGGRHHEVAFVLTVLVIGHNDELPRGDVREGCLDAVKGLVHETVRFEGDESARWCKRGDGLAALTAYFLGFARGLGSAPFFSAQVGLGSALAVQRRKLRTEAKVPSIWKPGLARISFK
ncbi:MAG: hypothetical protein RL309_626 [Verrucomicrobiota bacterium]